MVCCFSALSILVCVGCYRLSYNTAQSRDSRHATLPRAYMHPMARDGTRTRVSHGGLSWSRHRGRCRGGKESLSHCAISTSEPFKCLEDGFGLRVAIQGKPGQHVRRVVCRCFDLFVPGGLLGRSFARQFRGSLLKFRPPPSCSSFASSSP